MEQATVLSRLTEAFDALPPQLQEAARWMLDHPADVALLTTREQAKRAGLQPATLTRLAQRLGFEGYDAIRQVFAAALRERPESFRGRAADLIVRRDDQGEAALAQDLFAALGDHLRGLSAPDSIARLTRAATLLANARQVFCLGLRSSFPAAYMLDYIHALIGEPSTLVDMAGGRGIDALRAAGPGDVLVVVTVDPYTRQTIQAAEFARTRGATILAITDSLHAPIAALAEHLVLVRTETPSFFHTMTPAFAVVECLAALITAARGDKALAAIADGEAQLAAFDTFLKPNAARRRSV